MEPTQQSSIRVFCPVHKATFDAPHQPQVVCEIVEHTLTADLARAEYWEYCCNCQTFWPCRLGQSGSAEETCPSCQRAIARRYLCHECKLVSVESEEAAKGKIYAISERGIAPGCPHCGAMPTPAAVHSHQCAEAQAVLLSEMEVCPFCEVSRQFLQTK